jgi:hypothetical protein
MQERRKSGRSRGLKGAKLFFCSSSMIDCVVRNFTNAGARIEVFGGLLSTILIGLFIENVVFRLIETRTIGRWGMQN